MNPWEHKLTECGPSTTFTTSLTWIWLLSESRAIARKESFFFVTEVCLTDTSWQTDTISVISDQHLSQMTKLQTPQYTHLIETFQGLVGEYRTCNFQLRVWISSRPSASNLEQTANLSTVCSGQLSLLPSAGREMSSSSRVTGWRPRALIGAVVCLCAAPRVQLFAIAGNGWPYNAPRYHQLMPISCHFRDSKALLFESRKQCYNKYPDLCLFTFGDNANGKTKTLY